MATWGWKRTKMIPGEPIPDPQDPEPPSPILNQRFDAWSREAVENILETSVSMAGPLISRYRTADEETRSLVLTNLETELRQAHAAVTSLQRRIANGQSI